MACGPRFRDSESGQVCARTQALPDVLAPGPVLEGGSVTPPFTVLSHLASFSIHFGSIYAAAPRADRCLLSVPGIRGMRSPPKIILTFSRLSCEARSVLPEWGPGQRPPCILGTCWTQLPWPPPTPVMSGPPAWA